MFSFSRVNTLLNTAALLLASIMPSSFAQAAPPVLVVAQQIQAQPFANSIEALGTLQAREAVTLSVQITELIAAIHFDDGQRVQKGDLLIEMANTEEQALLLEAKAIADEAERQYQRVKSLHKQKLASDSLLDEKRLAADIARAKLQVVNVRLSDRIISAPFAGVMGLRQVSLGSLVRPGDTLATLDDDRVMKLDISIPALFIGAVEVGMSISAVSGDLNSVFSGTVASIDSRINPVTRSVIVRALIDNPDYTLKSGMLMQVQLKQPSQMSLMLPEEALVQEGVNMYAFVVNKTLQPNKVEKRKLQVGARSDGKIIVNKGLNAGDWVVTRGTMRLNDGREVKLSEQAL